VVLSLLFGLANAVDNPTRQSFVGDMVDREHLRNAVTLNSTMVNVARAVGPAIAGVLVATVGVGFCFLVNAASFAAVVVALAMLDVSKLHPATKTVRAKGQLREGFHYVRVRPALFAPLMMMALVGTLTYEFQVSLPLVAHNTFHGGASYYSALTASNGIGAVAGGLYAARRSRTGLRALTRAAVFFGITVLAAALAPWFWLEIVVIAAVGAASVGFLTTGNSTVQLTSDPQFRGRVMALWSVAFLGSTPIGSPIVGALADVTSARWSLVLGALACGVAAAIGLAALRRLPAPATT
jgi:MFS family permease